MTCKSIMKMHKFKIVYFKFHFIQIHLQIFFNFLKKCSFVSINSIRLQEDLQPTLGSLSQFFITNIRFFKFFNYKHHLLRLMNMPAKEKILSIFICNPIQPNIYPKKKLIEGKMDPCFCHHWKRHLISLHIHLKY
jgi:hypothetical protein